MEHGNGRIRVRTDRTLKRAPAVIAAGAVVGFAGVIVFHTGAGTPAAAGTPATGTTPAGSAGSAGSHPAGKTAGRRARHHRAHHAVTGSPATRSATGPAVNFSYGTIAVRVTVSGTRVTRVSVASLSTLEPTSQQISSYAIPTLRSEVLSAQSASINGVSGATYTSQGYARSVQAALDQMHA
jgi:uncharacterized protein with FMN-binding domain